jgi:hypothetical protein
MKQPEKIKKKQLFTIKLEAMAPIELTYKVWAETPEQAVDLLKTATLTARPKPIIARKRNIKATVYRYGTMVIEFVKNFR